jgi:hypothetical protein
MTAGSWGSATATTSWSYCPGRGTCTARGIAPAAASSSAATTTSAWRSTTPAETLASWIGMGLYDSWLAHHTLAMGTSARCDIDRAIDGFDCGPLKSGESVGFVLRATPDDGGTFKYGLRLYERAKWRAAGHQESRRERPGSNV